MAKMSAERIKQGVRFFEKTFGKLYEIRTHHPENIQTGRAIYTANHFHHFDPIFILHAIASQRGVIAHQMAKPSLYRIPLIGKAMRRWGTIVTPRPSHGEEISFEEYARMKIEVESALENDEALSFAYAGTMTDNFELADRSKQVTPDEIASDHGLADERRLANSGLLSIVRKKSGLCIVPVAVETYQRRTRRIYLDALLAISGLHRLWPRRRRHAVDISFGQPISIDEYLATTDPGSGLKRNRASLMDSVILKIWDLRYELLAINAGDPKRSLAKYY